MVLYKVKRKIIKRAIIIRTIIIRRLKLYKFKYSKISYSQSGEDLIVKSIFDQLGIKKPSYIDVGAHHPFYLSNTALFFKNGSRGINIEPDPTLFKAFLKHRKEDVNLNLGISNCNSELDFYLISTPTLNTFSKEEAENYSKEGNYKVTSVEKISVKTINEIINDYGDGRFPHFLNLDAEGVDEIIIRALDFDKNYPIVICVETNSFSTSRKGIKNVDLIDYIKNQGYVMYADTYLNTIFVRAENWSNN